MKPVSTCFWREHSDKKLACILFAAALLISVGMWRCSPKPASRVTSDFYRDKNCFSAVAAYIENFDWEQYGMHRTGSDAFFIHFDDRNPTNISVSHPEYVEGIPIPKPDRITLRAVRLLFDKLGYRGVEQSWISGQTIIFHQKSYPLDFDYYNQGVCYVIDGSKPTPELNLDYFTETITPLGDNWYYWNGHCYFG